MSHVPTSTQRRRFLVAGAATAAAAFIPGMSARAADAWPSKPIKLIVGFAPGGITDGLPRLYAPVLAEKLGTSVVIENKVGVAGNIATTFVATAPPDGYTLLASGVGQIVVLPHTSNMTVNPLTDLVHISMVGDGDQILNVNADVPAKNLAGVHRAGEGEAGRAELRRRGCRRQPEPVPRVLQDARRRRHRRRALQGRRPADARPAVEPRAARPQRAIGGRALHRAGQAAAADDRRREAQSEDARRAHRRRGRLRQDGGVQQLARPACAEGHARRHRSEDLRRPRRRDEVRRRREGNGGARRLPDRQLAEAVLGAHRPRLRAVRRSGQGGERPGRDRRRWRRIAHGACRSRNCAHSCRRCSARPASRRAMRRSSPTASSRRTCAGRTRTA